MKNSPQIASVESNQFHKQFMLRLFFVSLAFLTILLGSFSYIAMEIFKESYIPEQEQKIKLVGDKLSRDISRAVSYGIPVNKLRGMDVYLNEIIRDNSDIAHIEITTSDISLGTTDEVKVSYRSTVNEDHNGHNLNDNSLNYNVKYQKNSIADITIYPQKDHIENKLKSMSYDIFTALLIALLVTFELLSFFVYGRIFGPLDIVDKVLTAGAKGNFKHTVHSRAISELENIETSINEFLYKISERIRDVMDSARELRASQIADASIQKIDKLTHNFHEKITAGTPYSFKDMPSNNIKILRFPLFIFMFAEELSRAFLPILAQQYHASDWLSKYPNLVAGLPITIFMGVLVLISLISGRWIEKLGAKRMFTLGAIPAIIGYFGVFWAEDYTSFLLCRAATAVGYAMIFVACQGYVAAHSAPTTRAANMAVFVGAILVAGVCGPAIGGILADQIGYVSTFLISAVLAALALIIMLISLEEDELDIYQMQNNAKSAKLSFDILLNKHFAALSICCAIPAKMMLTGVIFLLTPLYLISQEIGEANIGRVIMIYGIAVVLLMPQMSKFADRSHNHSRMVIFGGIIAGIGGIFLQGDYSGLWPMVGVVLMIGIGNALSISSQLAVVQSLFAQSSSKYNVTTGLGVFRSIERIGSVLGPLIAGALAALYNIEIAIGLLCALGFLGAGLYWSLQFLWAEGN